uniref:Putative myb-like protein X n=1 Tax=Davidia involucrata TaxID=16924 RepID=A0A5B7ACB6_DAVIN
MSRCFPFPPPGYEKKDRPDDTNLLTKEKHKEKRHKKDKKDKEKREGKGKKDKERNKEKHKEKKDPKEKHKDKKEKDRDKEKRRTSDEKKIVGPPEYHNGEKLDPNCPQSNETKDSKFFVELGKRIRDEGGARENQMVQEVSATDQRRAELPRKVVDNNIGNLAEGKDKYKEKTEDDRKANGQRNKVEERGMENLVVQDFTGLDKKRVGGVARPADKDFEKQRNGKEKNKKKDSDSRGDRHKDRDREKKRKSKDKDSDKKKEKEEKAKEKEPNKEQPKLKESNKDVLDIFSTKTSYLLKESNKSSASNGNLGKRKEHERNGFLHENGIRPIKLLRPVSSSHQVVENGRKLEPCQMALHFASKGQGEANNHKVDNKISLSHPIMEIGRKLEPGQGAIHSASETQGAANNHKKYNKEPRINGLIEAQQPNVCLMKPSSAPVQAKVKVESSVKPQHPDSKYLSQILSIPKVEWSDFDDQGWLFSSKNLQAEKPTVGSSEVDGTLEVWAEALQIESADVTALPYVIPY